MFSEETGQRLETAQYEFHRSFLGMTEADNQTTNITSSYTAKGAHDYQKNWKRTSVNDANKTAKCITEF
jgi:hypothetical protein